MVDRILHVNFGKSCLAFLDCQLNHHLVNAAFAVLNKTNKDCSRAFFKRTV